MTGPQRILALSGGVGGAKLAAGLAQVLGEHLSVIVNTADDFDHLGLRICPDLDSVMYRLAGLNDTERGWGRQNETWNFLETLHQIGGPDWFRLGDRDMAVHVWRTAQLNRGGSLRDITRSIAAAMEIKAQIVPMSEDPVATILSTDEGVLPFQEYFVVRQCAPRVRSIVFEGAKNARPAPELLARDFDGIVICPSNPFVSIDPILSLPGVRDALKNRTFPVIAVSPFIEGAALKGPAAKMSRERGSSPSTSSLISHYSGLIDALVVDPNDVEITEEPVGSAVSVIGENIIMTTEADAERLALVLLGRLQDLKGTR